jgi:hypothetical protein
MPEDQTRNKRIQQAVEALRNGNKSRARFLIQAELRENPESVEAWAWACDLTKSVPEKILCLRKILSLDPDHQEARQYLARLKTEPETGQAAAQDLIGQLAPVQDSGSRLNVIDFLLAPFAWLYSISLPAALVLAFLGLSFAGYAYYRVNTNLLGRPQTNPDRFNFSPDWDSIEADGYRWDIRYENSGYANFSGTVRHVGPIRVDEFKILTHDILVTTGDFADPDQVTTNVLNHRFFWHAPYTQQPEGSINLLHIIPANRETAGRLFEVRKWQQVKISGYEILEIQAYNKDGEFLMSWKDTGCNTILVDQVQIIED